MEQLRRVRKIYRIIFASGVCIAFTALFFTRIVIAVAILQVLGVAVIFASLIYLFRHWRCPYCDAQLEIRESSPNFCSSCGKDLR